MKTAAKNRYKILFGLILLSFPGNILLHWYQTGSYYVVDNDIQAILPAQSSSSSSSSARFNSSSSSLESYSESPSQTKSDGDAVVTLSSREVIGLFDLWNDALVSGNPDTVARRYAKDAVLLPTKSDVPRTDYRSIRDYFVDFLAKQPTGTTIIERYVQSQPSYATDVGVYEFAFRNDPQRIRARYSFLYSKDDDGVWKIKHHHSSEMPEARAKASVATAKHYDDDNSSAAMTTIEQQRRTMEKQQTRQRQQTEQNNYQPTEGKHNNSNSSISKVEQWRSWGHVHVVVTAFMQNQANLTALGRARLRLFQEFCYPTMVHQTTQEFVWIIKIDPAMERKETRRFIGNNNHSAAANNNDDNDEEDIVGELIRMIKPHPNFILVGTNDHSRWVADDFPRHINRTYYGDDDLLRYVRSAYARFGSDDSNGDEDNTDKTKSKNETATESNGLLLLTTKLDSDDGLHSRYLEMVQKEAKENMVVTAATATKNNTRRSEKRKRADWLIWCVKRHIEWHTSDGRPRRRRNVTAVIGATDEEEEHGEVNTKTARICITPGMTIGYAPGAVFPDYMKNTNHGFLLRNVTGLGGCGLKISTRCISVVEDIPLAAVRSRTVTSAGMNQVRPAKRGTEQKKSATIWKTLKDEFGVSVEGARSANRYFLANGYEIARDNELGQCTEGHSCKEYSLVQLLNEQIRWALDSGGSETVLPADEDLFRNKTYNFLTKRMNSTEKRQWLNNVELAREKRRAAATAALETGR